MNALCTIEIDGEIYYIDLENLKHRFFRRQDTTKFHIQHSYHMILVSKGSNRLLLRDAHPVEVKTNSLMFINPLVPHQFEPDPGTGVEHTSIIWNFKNKSGNYANFPLQQLITGKKENNQPFVISQLTEIEAARFIEKEREAERYAKCANFFSASMIFFELWFLGLRLILKDDIKLSEKIDSTDALIEKIKFCVEWNLKNSALCIKTISQNINMHHNYLNTLFKAKTGITIGNFIRLRRIELAKIYLNDTSLPISNIAELCGFNQHSHFTRTFKKISGLNPLDYRNRRDSGFREVSSDI